MNRQEFKREILNDVALSEMKQLEKEFLKDVPVYEDRPNKLLGFIPFGSKKEIVGYTQQFEDKAVEAYYYKLSEYVHNTQAPFKDYLNAGKEFCTEKNHSFEEFLYDKNKEIRRTYNDFAETENILKSDRVKIKNPISDLREFNYRNVRINSDLSMGLSPADYIDGKISLKKDAENFIDNFDRDPLGYYRDLAKAYDQISNNQNTIKEIYSYNNNPKNELKYLEQEKEAKQYDTKSQKVSEAEKQGGSDDGREHLNRQHTLPNTLKDKERKEKLEPKDLLANFGGKDFFKEFAEKAQAEAKMANSIDNKVKQTKSNGMKI